MSAPHEPPRPRDSLVRAQFAPDSRRSSPDEPARLALILDNHDTAGQLVRVELSGPLARYTRPRQQPRVDLRPGRQREVTLEVRPEDTRPEGGYTYDLTAVVVDDKQEKIVSTCTARIGVERYPQVSSRAEPAKPKEVTDQGVVMLRVHVRNSGNVPVLVDARRVNPELWVLDRDRRMQEKMLASRRAVLAERSSPRTPERLRPRQTHDFEVAVEPRPYLIGIEPRRWRVPVGIHGENIEPDCVWVDFVQRPRVKVERRVVWLGAAVGAALLVLVIFMAVLAAS
jgi:hypothetical protein